MLLIWMPAHLDLSVPHQRRKKVSLFIIRQTHQQTHIQQSHTHSQRSLIKDLNARDSKYLCSFKLRQSRWWSDAWLKLVCFDLVHEIKMRSLRLIKLNAWYQIYEATSEWHSQSEKLHHLHIWLTLVCLFNYARYILKDHSVVFYLPLFVSLSLCEFGEFSNTYEQQKTVSGWE